MGDKMLDIIEENIIFSFYYAPPRSILYPRHMVPVGVLIGVFGGVFLYARHAR